jgi:glutamyl/glutaminyl-tRNA synthetase
LPKFGHIPVVNEPAPKPGAKYPPGVKPPNKNKKLSKRDMAKFVTPEVRAQLNAIGWTDEQIAARDDLNPATVAFYRELGYLPDGLINYLGRLGWSLDDKTEFIPLDQMLSHFDLETGLGRVNSSPGEFDPKKLFWLQDEYMKLLALEDKVRRCLPFLQRAKYVPDPAGPGDVAKLEAILRASGDRVKLFSDILQYGGPIFRRDPEYNPKAVDKRLKKAGAADLVRAFVPVLKACEPFDAPTTEKAMTDFCTAGGIKLGDMVHPVRVATTGVEVGFGLFDTLAILGKDEVLRRVKLALELV